MTGIRFDHIAIAAHRLADAAPFLAGVLGGTPGEGGDSQEYRWGQWCYDGGGRLEVLEPRGADGFLRRHLVARGPGVHHVTFRVPSLRAVCERAVAHGYRVVGYDDADPAWSEAFLHPKEALGIVVQFAESRAPGGPRPWTPPPAPPALPPPVAVVGLRLRARSAARAHAQWAGVLEGEAGEGPGGTLLFRWPRSPMRLAVEIVADAEEGAVAIEIAAARAVVLPAGPVPALGSVVRQVSA